MISFSSLSIVRTLALFNFGKSKEVIVEIYWHGKEISRPRRCGQFGPDSTKALDGNLVSYMEGGHRLDKHVCLPN
jgi:hypothetical protein